MVKRRDNIHMFEDNPLWYQDAIIYELPVRAFADSDGDGVGDFLGLIDKLDYLQDLGITAIWILPFYLSPLKDDGYDISDFTGIQPIYGTMRDFKTLVAEAHRRNIRIITELVINHTSDQHPWFQRARAASKESHWRNFYVWSDTPDKYKDARIIFKDFESSNWTLDPVAKSYYWHRFYSHQPDLNFDSQYVQRSILKVVDFWLRQGVDGLRVDAVPYLYEREGTTCENLPETHAFLKKLRKYVDAKYKNRMLLAEANQWPEDAVAYFGNGDEFNMAFHFPLMPRMFMAIQMQDRFPIMDILNVTPAIPQVCQWALFLRNHDELTLEMVTDEERDYMYRVFAHDPAARLNLGIRRRLAPLLSNDRRKIELMNGILFSLPGTPVIYYGDEIGMGDNFYLGDRNGVRTPMQWSPDKNAGFSYCNPQKLFLPVIIDPEYHYETINVEAQQSNPHSLLWRMKRTISLRKRYKAFGRGSLEFLLPANRNVLAFLRRYDDETILVIANLSHSVQHVELNLPEFEGKIPRELFGGTEFYPIGVTPYFITLGPYAFYWLSIEPKRKESFGMRVKSQKEPQMPAYVPITEKPEELFEKKENWPKLERVLLNYVTERRWFRSKTKFIEAADITDIVPMHIAQSAAYCVLLEIHYQKGEAETYALPLIFSPAKELASIINDYPQAIIAHLQSKKNNAAHEVILYDAMVDKDFCNAVLTAISQHRRFKGYEGTITASPLRSFRTICSSLQSTLEPTPVKTEQTNTSIFYQDQMILKLFRKLEEGINPELEVGRFLTENTSFTNIAPVAGMIEYRKDKGEPASLAILQGFVRNEGDAWQYTLDSLARYFNNVLAHPTVQVPPVPQKHILYLSDDATQLAKETIGPYLSSAKLLGQRTAQLHTTLASSQEFPDFAPEAFTIMYQNSVYHSMRHTTILTLQLIRQNLKNLSEETAGVAQKLLNSEKPIMERFHLIRNHKIQAFRIRCHGDFHLGQVLFTGKDFVIIDFEGEPARPLTERRIKRSPLRDVAAMIRSFHYASHMATSRYLSTTSRKEDTLVLKHWGEFWYTWISSAYLSAYLQTISEYHLLPKDSGELQILLDAYILDKAIYEVGYELNNRPDWVHVPILGILHLIEA